MNAKTELLLYQMLWGASRLMHPQFRKLDEGFEAWAYRHGLLRQIRRLEEAGYLESRQTAFDGRRLHRLTKAGRLAALGGRDPEEAWDTSWDGKWRLFLFDIPEVERSLRRKLARTLSASGCGRLQGSVWIAPHVPDDVRKLFSPRGGDCSHLLTLEAQSKGPSEDRQMVKAAWDFATVNSHYNRHLETLRRFPKVKPGDSLSALASWAETENARWLEAVRADPLLPASLLPRGYLGQRAWRQRQRVLARAGRVAERIPSASPSRRR